MKIGIVGAGKLGFALALALKEKGQDISGIYSRNQASAAALNEKLGLQGANDLMLTIKNAEIIFIVTPDTAIRAVAQTIAEKTENSTLEGKRFLHCSGALTSDVLQCLREKGALTASFHPIQTFSDKEWGWKGLSHIYFGYEGCEGLKEAANEMAALLDSKMLVIGKEAKPLYHAAACILSNYMVTLSYVTEEILSHIGIQKDIGIKAFIPLLENTVKNIRQSGSIQALTGPISRGDDGVIRQHLTALQVVGPDTREIYRVLGRKTIEAAMNKGTIGEEEILLLKEILRGEAD